jgi:hypothetical protein
MKSARIAVALASAILLSGGFVSQVFAKGNSVSHEPSRLFEGVPRTAPERNGERRTDQDSRTPRKCCCTGLFELLCD